MLGIYSIHFSQYNNSFPSHDRKDACLFIIVRYIWVLQNKFGSWWRKKWSPVESRWYKWGRSRGSSSNLLITSWSWNAKSELILVNMNGTVDWATISWSFSSSTFPPFFIFFSFLFPHLFSSLLYRLLGRSRRRWPSWDPMLFFWKLERKRGDGFWEGAGHLEAAEAPGGPVRQGQSDQSWPARGQRLHRGLCPTLQRRDGGAAAGGRRRPATPPCSGNQQRCPIAFWGARGTRGTSLWQRQRKSIIGGRNRREARGRWAWRQ